MKQNKKRIIGTIAVVAMVIGVIAPASHPEASAAQVKLNKKNLTLYVGQKKKLKVKGTKKKIKWSSSKKKVASVDKKGVVTAKKTGTAKITAKVGKKKYTCVVNILTNEWKRYNPLDLRGINEPGLQLYAKELTYTKKGDLDLELYVVNLTGYAKVVRIHDTTFSLVVDERKMLFENAPFPDMDVNIPDKQYSIVHVHVKKKDLKIKNFAFEKGVDYTLRVPCKYNYIWMN